MPTPHPWRFARLGGFDQVRLETAQDYARLGELDQKLWAALACPVKGLEIDERTLALIDGDMDGRIRVPEILEAIRWAGANLADLGSLRAGSDSLPLAQIADKALLASAKRILPAHGTAAAADAWKAVRAKVDDWFARCRMAAFDPRALGALNRREEEYLAIAAKDFTISASEIAGFPLARVEAGRALPLAEGVNPAWAGALDTLRTAAVEPLLGKGKTSLTEAEWTELGAKLAPFEAWRGLKPAAAPEKLGLPRLREILAGGSKEAIGRLIDEDRAVEPEFQAIGQVERLVRYHRDLHRLLVNFVNFSDFYSRVRPATFQAGTLYLDGRSCDLCVRVDDAGKHAALAGFSKAYLAYCAC